jgi:hypothetical protein
LRPRCRSEHSHKCQRRGEQARHPRNRWHDFVPPNGFRTNNTSPCAVFPEWLLFKIRHSGMVREHKTRNLEISTPRRPE